MDRGDLLPLIRRNFDRNSNLFGDCDVRVAELDFFSSDTSSAAIRDRLDLAEVILVADVVYDRDITEVGQTAQ